MAARCAAPVLPGEPATTSTCPNDPLCASGRRTGTSARRLSGVIRRTSGGSIASMTSAGIPMSATTTFPASSSAGGSASGSFGAPSVTVSDARMQGPITSAVSAERPLGRSIDTTSADSAFTSLDHPPGQPGERRRQPRAEQGVHDEIARADRRRVPIPVGLVRDLDDRQRQGAQALEVGAGVAFDVGGAAEEEHRDVDVPLPQRPGHDQAVPAVVAAPAEHRHAPAGEVAERGVDGGDHLQAGVLHQEQRRDADLLDRAPIGLAHLFRGEDPHREASWLPGRGFVNRRRDGQAGLKTPHGSLHSGRPEGPPYTRSRPYVGPPYTRSRPVRRPEGPPYTRSRPYVGRPFRVASDRPRLRSASWRGTLGGSDGRLPGRSIAQPHRDAEPGHRTTPPGSTLGAAFPHRDRGRDGPAGGRLPPAAPHRGHAGREGPGPLPGDVLHQPARSRADALARRGRRTPLCRRGPRDGAPARGRRARPIS